MQKPLFTEHGYIPFPNKNPPFDEMNNAYCEVRKALNIFYFFYFIYFNEFLFCYVLHFIHTDPYEHVGKTQKKEKKTKHIYIANSHTITC